MREWRTFPPRPRIPYPEGLTDAALRETLKTMSAVVIEAASVSIPLLGAHLTEDGMVQDRIVSNAIKNSLIELYETVIHGKAQQGASSPLL